VGGHGNLSNTKNKKDASGKAIGVDGQSPHLSSCWSILYLVSMCLLAPGTVVSKEIILEISAGEAKVWFFFLIF
jgi:hypothetical protein